MHNLSGEDTGYYIVNEGFGASPGLANANDDVLPSAFMPPLYAYFIYIIKLTFSNFVDYVSIIIIIQILLSVIAAFLFFKILKISETSMLSFYSALIFSLIPINIYASVQISSISIKCFF